LSQLYFEVFAMPNSLLRIKLIYKTTKKTAKKLSMQRSI